MTPEELKQIRERCEAATHDFRNSCAWERYVGASTEWRCGGPPAASLEQAKVDAAFIHHARADVPALLDEVERISMLHAAVTKTLDAALAAAERLQRERDELRARLVIEQSK